MKQFILLLLTIFPLYFLTAQNVFKTPSGKKYHLANCRMVKNVSEQITIKQGEQLGLTPCKICQPVSNFDNSNNSLTKAAQGTNKNTEQCKGLTKAGTRCKHMTNIGNGYCFQHQP